MKKLLTLIASVIALSLAAYGDVSLRGAYTSKLVEFGSVTQNSVYTVGASSSWESFSFDVETYNSLHLSPFSAALHRVDLTGGYKFTSTLADVVVGATYVNTNNPGRYDFVGHWRPSVKVGKDFYQLSAAYDLQSRLSNVELKLHGKVDGPYGLLIVAGGFAGYTDVADALPKTVKAINYDNAYIGCSLDVMWKQLGVGAYVVRDGHRDYNPGGWRVYGSHSF